MAGSDYFGIGYAPPVTESDLVLELDVVEPSYGRLLFVRLLWPLSGWIYDLPGQIRRQTQRSRTTYRVPGYAPGRRFECRHSTMIQFRHVGSSDDQTFLFALDRVDAGFDDLGYLTFEYDFASMIEGNVSGAQAVITSYVLVGPG